MAIVGRLSQYAAMLTNEFNEITANNPTITGLGTYYASEFNENISDTLTVEYLVVAGGGGGGTYGGGGGAGGMLASTTTLSSGNYEISVGTGGNSDQNGSNSSLGSIIAIGGGRGANAPGFAGGSGGGSGTTGGAAASGQGNPGGGGEGTGCFGGGGGAGSAGGTSVGLVSGNGGNGLTSQISGSIVTYAGGGGGGSFNNASRTPGNGGTGGGGNGSRLNLNTPGSPNTGGGGGGGGANVADVRLGASGGSGIVIVRYPGSQVATGGSVTSSGGYTIHTFTTVGISTFTISIRPILTANVFKPYDPVYDEFAGVLYGPGQGGYMRQKTDKSAIVYNEIDEITTDFYGRGNVMDGLILDLDAGIRDSYSGSGTSWTDLSGSVNNGTLTNGPTYSSANGGSLVFNGSNNFIDFTSDYNLLPTAGLTVSVWFKTTVSDRWLVTKTSDSLVNGYAMDVNSAGLSGFYVNTRFVNSPSVTTTGNWINSVGTWTPSTSILLYQNGTQVASNTTSIPASIIDPSYTLDIGRRPNGPDYWNGNIAQVSIYNRALSAAEIKQNYNALRNRFGL